MSGVTEVNKGEIMDQVRMQMALANTQELLTKMTEKCFDKCIKKPGTSLDSSEQKCISMCMDRFLDSFRLVYRTYGNRINKHS